MIWAIGSGLLCALALPPVGWSWVLGWAPALGLWCWYRGDRVGWLGFWWGVAYAIAISWYSVTTFDQKARVEGLGGVAWTLAVLWFASWYALAGWWVGRSGTEGAWWAVLVASVWTVVSWLRSLGSLGFPWGMLAMGWVRQPIWLQPADLGGVWLVEWLTVFWNALLVIGLKERKVRYAMALALLGIGWTAYGIWALRFYGAETGNWRVAVVQPKVATVSSASNTRFAQITESFIRRASAQGAQCVVFPEVYEAADESGRLPHHWKQWSQKYHVSLLLGASCRVSQHAYNSAFWQGSGDACGRYDKVKLMAFTEWSPPFGRWLWWFGVMERSLVAGNRVAPLQMASEPPVGVLICVESLFGWVARAHTRAGAQWQAVISNDSWLLEPVLQEQYADYCALRAIETRRWVVRASSVGLTGFCSPTGAMEWLPPDQRLVKVQAIRPMTVQTPYVRWGDFWVYLCLVGLVVGLRRA